MNPPTHPPTHPPNHVVSTWLPPTTHDQVNPKQNVVLSCLDNNILMVTGTRSIVHKYTLSSSDPTTTTPQLHTDGFLEAHNTSPFHTVCQSRHAIYAGCKSGDIAVYGVASRAWSKCVAHSKPITCMSPPSGTGAPIITGTTHGSCAAHDATTMLEVGRAAVHAEKVTWVRAWEHSSYLSTSNDGTAALWDARAPPKNRIVKRFQHGGAIALGSLFQSHVLCTASLPFEKNPTRHSKKGYVRRRSVLLNFWDLRKSKAMDTAKMIWDGVDVSHVRILPTTDLDVEGTRQRFTLLSVGQRTGPKKSESKMKVPETWLQGCNERGERKFSVKPIHRTFVGGQFCEQGIVLVSTDLAKQGNKHGDNNTPHHRPELSFLPTHPSPPINKDNASTRHTVDKKRSTQRLSLVTWNKKLARLGARGKCVELLDALTHMLQQHVYPNSVSFEVVLRAMVKHKTLILVAAVLDHMHVLRIRPLDQTCIALLRLAASKRTNPFAQELMQRLSKIGNPTVREVFVELLLINATKASLQLAFDMLMETATRKLGISRRLIQAFLKAAHARRSTDLAFRLLTAIKEKSQTTNGLQATEFETVACMLATIRETKKALALLSQALEVFGLSQSVFDMACALIQSFGRAGLLSATSVIHAMLIKHEYYEKGGVPTLPPVTTNNTVGFARQGGEKTSEWPTHIGPSSASPVSLAPPPQHHKEWKVGPRVQFAAAHIDAALSCARPDVAMQVLKHLKVNKAQTHHKSFVFLSNALIRFVSILEADVLPDKQTQVIGCMQTMGMRVPYECFVSLLGCLALQKRITESMYLFNCLRHFKEDTTTNPPHHQDDTRQNHAFSVLISAVGRAGLAHKLNGLLTDVFAPKKGNHVVHVDLQIIESAVEALRCIEEPRRAIETWIKGGRKLTRLVCNNVLICYGMTCRIKQMSALVTEMKLNGCRPDADTYSALLIGCMSAGRLDKAVFWLMEFCTFQERRGRQAVNNIVVWYHELQDTREKRKRKEKEEQQQQQQQQRNSLSPTNEPKDAQPLVKSTQMVSAIRRLLAKQQRLRKSTRSHPDMAETMVALMDRLMRTQQHTVAMRCLKRICWVCGSTDPNAAVFVLESGCAREKNKYSIKEHVEETVEKENVLSAFQQWQLQQQQQQASSFQRWEQQVCESTPDVVHPIHQVGMDLEWILKTIEPHRLLMLSSDLFGQAVEQAAVARKSELAGYVTHELIQTFAAKGGILSSSIVEAMLRASECERAARLDQALDKSHLEHPLVIWQKAAECGVHVSDRARLLFLRALVAMDAVDEAMSFLKSFHGKGCRVTPLGWMLKTVCQCDRLDDVLYLYNIERGRNHAVPKFVEMYVKQKRPRKEEVFRHRRSLGDLLSLKKREKKMM